MEGTRNGEVYLIKDDLPILKQFSELYSATKTMLVESKAECLSNKVLSNTEWWRTDLTQFSGLASCVSKYLSLIWSSGMHIAMNEVVKK